MQKRQRLRHTIEPQINLLIKQRKSTKQTLIYDLRYVQKNLQYQHRQFFQKYTLTIKYRQQIQYKLKNSPIIYHNRIIRDISIVNREKYDAGYESFKSWRNKVSDISLDDNDKVKKFIQPDIMIEISSAQFYLSQVKLVQKYYPSQIQPHLFHKQDEDMNDCTHLNI